MQYCHFQIMIAGFAETLRCDLHHRIRISRRLRRGRRGYDSDREQSLQADPCECVKQAIGHLGTEAGRQARFPNHQALMIDARLHQPMSSPIMKRTENRPDGWNT